MKLVTFCASNFTNSEYTYSPLCTLTAVKFESRVAIVSFSSSVICFATTLLILVTRPLDILPLPDSEYRRARSVNESTHANMVTFGKRVAVSISPHV